MWKEAEGIISKRVERNVKACFCISERAQETKDLMPFINMLTRWHKTFHILVLGSLAVLALAVFAIKREFRVEQKMAGDEMPEGAAQGGVTPEETFAMFLEALKAGDTELASRYFVITRRQSWQESLRQIKAGGGLRQCIASFQKFPLCGKRKARTRTRHHMFIARRTSLSSKTVPRISGRYGIFRALDKLVGLP